MQYEGKVTKKKKNKWTFFFLGVGDGDDEDDEFLDNLNLRRQHILPQQF